MTLTAGSTALQATTPAVPRIYPRKIVISSAAELFLADLASDLVLGRVELHQLSPALLDLIVVGQVDGHHARDIEVAALTYKADRYYYEFSRRKGQPFIDPNQPSYAELERRRGHPERAAEIETANALRNAESFSDAE